MDLAQTRLIYVDRTKNGGLLEFTSLLNLSGCHLGQGLCVRLRMVPLVLFYPAVKKKVASIKRG